MSSPKKFRAWDTFRKEFIYPDSPGDQHHILTLRGAFHNLQNGSGGNDYVVEQWTGLRDVFGTDLYEGDVIQYSDEPDVVVVQWTSTYYPGWNVRTTSPEFGSFEIRGNIHQMGEYAFHAVFSERVIPDLPNISLDLSDVLC